MRPREKGWLKEYLEFRKELLKDIAIDGRKSSHPEHSLYRVVQPTGLMYGQSVDNLGLENSKDWDQKDRMKVVLAESLISSSSRSYLKKSETMRSVLV